LGKRRGKGVIHSLRRVRTRHRRHIGTMGGSWNCRRGRRNWDNKSNKKKSMAVGKRGHGKKTSRKKKALKFGGGEEGKRGIKLHNGAKEKRSKGGKRVVVAKKKKRFVPLIGP